MVIGQYGGRGQAERVDVHWRNQVDLCNPCALDYDYVIDFDHLQEDSDRLLDYLQRNHDNDHDQERLHFQGGRSVINSTYASRMIRDLPDDETKAEITAMFQRDIDIFDFNDLTLAS